MKPSEALRLHRGKIQKIVEQAQAYGVSVDMSSLRVSGVSGNLISDYVSWSVDVKAVNGRIDIFPHGAKAVITKEIQVSSGRCY